MDTGANVLAFVSRLRRLMEPLLEQIEDETWRACEHADAVIYSLLGFTGYHVAERLGIPCLGANLQPVAPTRAFPSFPLPLKLPLAGIDNWLSYVIGEQLFWQPFRGAINRWRKETLGLPPIPFTGPFRRAYQQRVPYLYGCSPTVVAKPWDWPEWYHVTGYWFLDHPADWQPPGRLVDFLAAGPPPVCVGLGSMRVRDPGAFGTLAVEALKRAGQRGILLSGWAGLRPSIQSDEVLVVDDVPHDWLFPRVAAVIHHGGAGTAAAAFRAGRPSFVIPFLGDQHFWSERIAALGVGPKAIPEKGLSAERFADAIRTITNHEGMKLRARALGELIRGEDGVTLAVEIFTRHVETV